MGYKEIIAALVTLAAFAYLICTIINLAKEIYNKKKKKEVKEDRTDNID